MALASCKSDWDQAATQATISSDEYSGYEWLTQNTFKALFTKDFERS